MEKDVAVVLSGCGVYDGAEIYESVLTLLALERAGARYQCFAPNVDQMHVINHLSGEVAEGESRNALVEAARIVRGDIKDLASANADEFDALICPGGFGAAKNLSNFATEGAGLTVQEDFLNFAQAIHQQGKPIGLICIAPTMSAAIVGEGVQCTIGGDEEVASAIEAMGATAINYKTTAVEDYVQQYTDGRGFDVVFDTVGDENMLASFEAAALNAQLVTTTSMLNIDLTAAHLKGLSIHVVFMLIPMLHDHGREVHQSILQNIASIADAGHYQPLMDDSDFDVTEVAQAYARLASGQAMGKLVLKGL